MRKSLLSLIALAMTCAQSIAMTWKFGGLNESKQTCQLTGWGGTQPSSGKLTIPSTYKKGGVTYKVTSVASHALDNLTEATVITIPKDISLIGKSVVGNIFGSVENFNNCPKLTKFVVEEGNKKFATVADGLLIDKTTSDDLTLFKVPQAYPVSNGTLTLPKQVTDIEDGCFNGNSTIKTLVLPTALSIMHVEGNLNAMTALKEIKMAGSSHWYKVTDGALIDAQDRRLVAYPVMRSAKTFTIPADVETIGKEAFANVKKLVSVVIPSTVSEVSRNAFAHSNLQSATISSSARYYQGSFYDCRSLKKIVFSGSGAEIPNYFATGCSALEEVASPDGVPDEVGDAAFKNCRALAAFPFSGSTALYSDSIFAGCGFREVKFDGGKSCGENFGFALFAGCDNLESLDMSAIVLDDNDNMVFYPDFGANCRKLKTVRFPRSSYFSEDYNSSVFPIFGFDSSVEKIVVGPFWCSPRSVVFVYNGGKVYRPIVYASLKDERPTDGEPPFPFSRLLDVSNGAKVEPIIYCDAYTPAENELSDKTYIFNGATYYIPGGAWVNWRDAFEAGCALNEMYTLDCRRVGGQMTVSGRPNYPNVVIRSVKVDDSDEVPAAADGSFSIVVSENDMRSLTVSYMVDDVEMMTVYPNGFADIAGVDSPEIVDTESAEPVYYTLQGLRVLSPAEGGVYIVRRGHKVTKEMFR